MWLSQQWTHAVDMATGETYNLNSHGNAALKGSVLPQPVDMVCACQKGCPATVSLDILAVTITGLHVVPSRLHCRCGQLHSRGCR